MPVLLLLTSNLIFLYLPGAASSLLGQENLAICLRYYLSGSHSPQYLPPGIS